jgi:hypothetical protein
MHTNALSHTNLDVSSQINNAVSTPNTSPSTQPYTPHPQKPFTQTSHTPHPYTPNHEPCALSLKPYARTS